jgi:hypothetical protein
MIHPLQAVPQIHRSRLLRTAIYLALAASLAMLWIGWPLRNVTAPLGIASLELAPDGAASTTIIDAWKQQHAGIRMDNDMSTYVQNVPRGLDELAATVTILGYGYALIYCLALSMICVWLGSPRLGAALGWLIWVGGLLDAIENTLLLRTLFGDPAGAQPEITHLFAWAKFATIAVCLAYAVRAVWRQRRRPAVR